jgi:hypothetical protein
METHAGPFLAVDPGSHGLVMDPIPNVPYAWYSSQDVTLGDTMQRYAIKVGISAAVNVMREFGGSGTSPALSSRSA